MSFPQQTLILSEEKSDRIKAVLDSFCQEADLFNVSLMEESGMLIAQSGEASTIDDGELGALSVASFASLKILSQRLGEPEFEGVYHEGRRRHLYMTPIGSRFLLLATFGRETTIGLVRFYSVRACAELDYELEDALENISEEQISPLSISAHLEEESYTENPMPWATQLQEEQNAPPRFSPSPLEKLAEG